MMMKMLAVFFLVATTLIPGCRGSTSSSSSSSDPGEDQHESNSHVDYFSSSSGSATADDDSDIRCNVVMSSDADEYTSSTSTVMCSFSLDAEQIQQALLVQSTTDHHQDDYDVQHQQEPIAMTTFTQCLPKSSLLLQGDIGHGDDDDEEYCIQAEIKVMSKRQLLEQQSTGTTRTSSSDDDYDDEEVPEDYNEEEVPEEYDDEEEVPEDYDDNEEAVQEDNDGSSFETDETAADMFADESSSSSSTASAATSSDNFSITVGTTVYTLPYSQYGTHVARVLRRHRPILTGDDDTVDDDWDDDVSILERLLLLQEGADLVSSETTQDSNKDNDVLLIKKGRSLLKRARWFQKLGMAHRVQLEEGYKSLELLRLQEQAQKEANVGGSGGNNRTASEEIMTKNMQDQVNFSIQAFNTAVQLNQQASLLQSSSSSSSTTNDNNGNDDGNVFHDSLVDGSSPLAILYYHIAETFALSPNPDQVALAQDYLIQSEQLFRRILHNQNEATYSAASRNSGHDLDFVDMQLSWAQCCLRLGVTLLNQSSGLAYAADDTTTTSHPDDSSKQQQQHFSKTMKSDYILASAAAAAAEGQHIPLSRKFLEMVDRSEAFFLQAERILRRAVEQETARRNAATANNNNILKRQQYQQENRRIASRDADLPFDAMDRLRPEKHFATALHNLASTALYKSDYAKSTLYLEEARQAYQIALTVLDKPHEHDLPQTLAWTNYDAVIVEVQLAMGEILYSLADVYLQQGKLRNAKNRYAKAMNWFEVHKIAPPATLTATLGGGGSGGGEGGDQPPLVSFILEDADGNIMGGAGGDDLGAAAGLLQGGLAAAVAEHERALEEYNQMFADGLNEAAAYMDENIQVGDEEYYFAKNDGYEGDLHTNLGTMYMAMGDDVQARSHFTQAMQLYSMSGEQGERTMADVKYNMAILEFRLGGYSESSQLYEEALDIFLELYGEGVNPMLMMTQQQQHDQTTSSSSTTGSKTSKTTATTTSTYHADTKEKPIEAEAKIKKGVATVKSTTTKKYDNGEDKYKNKIHVDLASFQKKGMLLNETRSDEL